MKRVLAALAVAAVLFTSCSDDDGSALGTSGGELSAEEQVQADRIAASVLEDDEDFPVTPEEADCVGQSAVRGLGAERAAQIDWDADEPDVTSEDAEPLAEAMVSCLDLAPLLAQSFTEEGELTPEQSECTANELSDDELKPILVFFFDNPDGQMTPEVAAPLADAVLECLDFGALLVEQFAAEGGDISEESAQCLADAIPDDLLRSMVISGMTGQEDPAAESEFERAVLAASADCLTAEELDSLGG